MRMQANAPSNIAACCSSADLAARIAGEERCLQSGVPEVDDAQPLPEVVVPGLLHLPSGSPLLPDDPMPADEREHALVC